jgi:hypothetical protein
MEIVVATIGKKENRLSSLVFFGLEVLEKYAQAKKYEQAKVTKMEICRYKTMSSPDIRYKKFKYQFHTPARVLSWVGLEVR